MPIVAQGSFGCVNIPSLKCKSKKPDEFYETKISKLMKRDEAINEVKEQRLFDKIDPSFNFHLPVPTLCKPNIREELEELKKCSVVRGNDGRLLPEDKLALMIIQNGGMDLGIFTYNFIMTADITSSSNTRIRNSMDVPAEVRIYTNEQMTYKTDVISKFWTNSTILLEALNTLLDNRVIHGDLKAPNIVYDHLNERLNIIDFGFTTTFLKFNKGRPHWSYPPETYLTTPFAYEAIRKLDQPEFEKYLGKNPPSKPFTSTYLTFLDVAFPNNMFVKGYDPVFKFKSRSEILELLQVGIYTSRRTDEYRKQLSLTFDMYGIGIALMYVFLRTYRYLGEWNNKKKEIIINKPFVTEMYQVLFSMVHPDPFQRPTIVDLRKKYVNALKLLVPEFVEPVYSNVGVVSLNETNPSPVIFETGSEKTISAPVPARPSSPRPDNLRPAPFVAPSVAPRPAPSVTPRPVPSVAPRPAPSVTPVPVENITIPNIEQEIMGDMEIPHDQYNTFISSEICQNENDKLRELDTHYIFVVDKESQKHLSTADLKEKDTHEIFVMQEATPPTKAPNEQDVMDSINQKIITLCNKKNIVIYVLLQNSSYKTNTFVFSFGNNLKEDVPDKYYNNMIIINMFDAHRLKLTDPPYIQYSACKRYCLANVIDLKTNSKKFFQVLNVCCSKPHDAKRILLPDDKHTKKFEYKFMHTSHLYDFKDVKDMIMERKCSSGKLIQFTGTCWMNALINAIVLPKISRKYLLAQAKKNVETTPENNKVPLYEIYEKRMEVNYENILTSILYNIFLKKQRPSDKKKELEHDFMLTLADKLKRHCYTKYNMDDQTRIKKFKPNNVKFGDGASITMITYVLKEILKQYLKDYQNVYRIFTTKTPDRMTVKDIAGMKRPALSLRIKKGRYSYRLTSCLIIQEGKHEICGYICGDKEYIYNSILKVAIECNWSKYDFQPYIDYYNNIYLGDLIRQRKIKPRKSKELKLYIELLIYTVESESDRKEMAAMEAEGEGENMFIPDFPCKLTDSSEAATAAAKPTKRNKKTKAPLTKCKKPDQELVEGKCFKICKPGQKRNDATKRCKKIKTATTRKMTRK